MNTSNISTNMIVWLSLATGISGLMGFTFIILFFSVGQPFGTLNDIFIGLTALLSLALAWKLQPELQIHFPLLGRMALAVAALGTILVWVGISLSISGTKGWYLTGLYMAAGNGMIGLWLMVLSYSALRENFLPQNQAIFGLICGLILALGVVTIPAIIRGTDSQEYVLTLFNSIWWTSSIGYLALYPTWAILLGRLLVRQ